MYSTDGGEFAYHTKSHIVRFFVFFTLFIVVSFFKQIFGTIRDTYLYWNSYLLLLVKYFGLTSSGSQRWLDFILLILQPSELMKVGLILFLAKYYHRISSGDVNRIKYLLTLYLL